MLPHAFRYIISVTRKNAKCPEKVLKTDFTRKMNDFDTFYKNCLKMWEIWANLLLPKGLKSCPKSNKSPDLVTLYIIKMVRPMLQKVGR